MEPDYSNYLSFFEEGLFYYSYYLIFGEAAPLFVIAITLLTNIFNNCASSPRRCFDGDEDEHNQVLKTAERYGIQSEETTIPFLLDYFEKRLEEVNQQIVEFDLHKAQRIAFVEGSIKRPSLSSVYPLFHKPLGDPSNLVHIIFDMAGISNGAQSKLGAKPITHMLKLAAHIKNAQPSQPDENGVVHFNPLYSFLNRMHEVRGQVKKANGENPYKLFRKYEETMTTKLEKQQGAAYDEKAVMRNIFEFAGLVSLGRRK